MPTVLMTGGHAGLGLVGARTLAQRFGCDLILAGRDPSRIEEVARRLRDETGAWVGVARLDLASLASVRACAAACRGLIADRGTRPIGLAAIVCNAGVQCGKDATFTADGFETTFAANCLGHFLLVNLLLDMLPPGGRIVWTASGTHDPATMDGRAVGAAVEPDAAALARGGRDGTAISGGRRYATSKLCTIMYAYELDRRLREARRPLASIAYDPGFLPEVGMGRNAPAIFRSRAAKAVLRAVGMTMGRMPLSGDALAMLAVDAAFHDASGKYYQSRDGALREARSSAISYDEAKAAKLWRDSAALVCFEAGNVPLG